MHDMHYWIYIPIHLNHFIHDAAYNSFIMTSCPGYMQLISDIFNSFTVCITHDIRGLSWVPKRCPLGSQMGKKFIYFVQNW